jgi:hypothetical protein
MTCDTDEFYLQPSSFIAHGAFHTLVIRATLSAPFMVKTYT